MKINDEVILKENNQIGKVINLTKFVEFIVKFDDGREVSYNWNSRYLFITEKIKIKCKNLS